MARCRGQRTASLCPLVGFRNLAQVDWLSLHVLSHTEPLHLAQLLYRFEMGVTSPGPQGSLFLGYASWPAGLRILLSMLT